VRSSHGAWRAEMTDRRARPISIAGLRRDPLFGGSSTPDGLPYIMSGARPASEVRQKLWPCLCARVPTPSRRQRRTHCMHHTTSTSSQRAPAPHRAALSTLIVFYTMGLAGMAFLLGVTTTPVVRRLIQASKGRLPAGAQARAQPQRDLPRLTPASDRPLPRRRRQPKARRVSLPVSERSRRPVTRARLQTPNVQTARRPTGARKAPRATLRSPQALSRMRIVVLPRRSSDIAWVNPPPASWPKECRPPEPGSGGRF
jgi:hypothetical protein